LKANSLVATDVLAVKYDNNFLGLTKKDTEFINCEARTDTGTATTAAHSSFASKEYYEKINLFLTYLSGPYTVAAGPVYPNLRVCSA
jgi:hypothetical protein